MTYLVHPSVPQTTYIHYPAVGTAGLFSLSCNTQKSFIVTAYTVAHSYIMVFSPRLAVSARLASRAFTSVRPVVPLTAARCLHSTPITMGEHPVATLNVCPATKFRKPVGPGSRKYRRSLSLAFLRHPQLSLKRRRKRTLLFKLLQST